MIVSPAKTAEPIEMLFGLWTHVGPRNHVVLDGGRDPHAKGQFCGVKGWPIVGPSDVSCAKTAEPVKMPFGVWNRMGPKKHVLDGGHIGTIWRIRLNRILYMRL